MGSLIFEKSIPGSNSFSVPNDDLGVDINIPADIARNDAPILPDVSEIELVRHYTNLSHQTYCVDMGLYPLGSCTMKYNPKIDEWAARLPGFAALHPYQTEHTVQGALQMMYDLGKMLCEICGMDNFSLQPAAGAHGEMAGIMMIKAYHQKRQDFKRTKMMIPDSAHGTNPATANVVGYDTVEIKSDARGLIDLEDLKAKMNDEIAGLMLTNPNTLGLFEEDIIEIAKVVHDGGGLLYYDGANLNPIMGICRPGDMGFDVVHLNLHKTFATPHGGGGPGSGPVGVKAHLTEFLPIPVVQKANDKYAFNYDLPYSIGKVKNFYGNFGVYIKAYTYLKAIGREGVIDAAEQAVLNANYLRHHLRDIYYIPYDRLCKHEFVANSKHQIDLNGVSTMDIAKRLIDYGYHPPTVYFPLIVKEAMMIEPTETESKQSLDDFITTMKTIAKEAAESPQLVLDAPHNTVIKRLDEVSAARNPVVKWEEV